MKKNELRKLGLILGVVSAGWGAWYLKAGIGASIYFLVVALLLLLLALFYPFGLNPVFILLTKLGSLLSWVVTRIILSMIFYLIMTPIGWWLRLTGKDLLQFKIQTKTKSYWLTCSGKLDKEQFTKQY